MREYLNKKKEESKNCIDYLLRHKISNNSNYHRGDNFSSIIDNKLLIFEDLRNEYTKITKQYLEYINDKDFSKKRQEEGNLLLLIKSKIEKLTKNCASLLITENCKSKEHEQKEQNMNFGFLDMIEKRNSLESSEKLNLKRYQLEYSKRNSDSKICNKSNIQINFEKKRDLETRINNLENEISSDHFNKIATHKSRSRSLKKAVLLVNKNSKSICFSKYQSPLKNYRIKIKDLVPIDNKKFTNSISKQPSNNSISPIIINRNNHCYDTNKVSVNRSNRLFTNNEKENLNLGYKGGMINEDFKNEVNNISEISNSSFKINNNSQSDCRKTHYSLSRTLINNSQDSRSKTPDSKIVLKLLKRKNHIKNNQYLSLFVSKKPESKQQERKDCYSYLNKKKKYLKAKT